MTSVVTAIKKEKQLKIKDKKKKKKKKCYLSSLPYW